MPRRSTGLRRLILTITTTIAATLTAGIVATTNIAHADDLPSNAQNGGRACVFYAPTPGPAGTTLGHVGWAVRQPGTDDWVLGSADGGNGNSTPSGSQPVSGAGSLSGGGSLVWIGTSLALPAASGSVVITGGWASVGSAAASAVSGLAQGSGFGADDVAPDVPADPNAETVWVARATSWRQTLGSFVHFGWYESYRCKDTSNGDANAVYNNMINDKGFDITFNNCLNHTRNALLAYNPEIIASFNWRALPSDWYGHLNEEGFSDTAPLVTS